MAVNARLQHVRGTTVRHASFTGRVGEFTYDTDKKVVVAHDGTTRGGFAMLREDRKIIAGNDAVKINGGAQTTLANDVTITVDASNVVETITNNTDTVKEIAAAVVSPRTGNLSAISVDDGKIYSSLTVEYNVATSSLVVKNKKGEQVSSTDIPSSGSLFKSAAVVVNPQDKPEGTYIDFVYEDAQTSVEKHFLIDVTTLVDVVTAGDGIDAEDNHISVKLAQDSPGLEFDGEGGLKIASDFTSGKTYVAGDGIYITDSDVIGVAVSSDPNNLIMLKEGDIIQPSA